MHTFIGRKSELKALEKEYERKSSFVVIYGRRRVGKTTLIKEFIKDKKALYYLAAKEMESENLKSFSKALAGFTGQGYFENIRFSDWESAICAFCDYKPTEKKVLIIDEFQYLAEVNPGFVSVFQRIWDEVLSKSNTMVIICGSLISMMLKEVLSYSSPLYGRRTAQIRLSPLKFYEMKEHFCDMCFEELVKLYSIAGGVPKYIELLVNRHSIDENVENEVFSKQGFLFEEPTFLLEKEVKETVSYFSIIKVIAAGHHKLGNIAGALELKTSQITPYLKTLMDLDIIEKQLPVTEKNPEKSKMGLYYIKDHFIEFWVKFVSPYKSELEIENMAPALKRYHENFVDTHESYVFEEISRETIRNLCMNGTIPFDLQKIGRFWNNNTEIDVCVLSDDGQKVLLGECKFHEQPIDAEVYFELQKKAETIEVFKDKNIVYAIFSKSGFTERLRELAKGNPALFLIDNGERQAY